ncbi:hypothetical protein LEMLEM_LOCUS9778 [Lemmus lemmus]
MLRHRKDQKEKRIHVYSLKRPREDEDHIEKFHNLPLPHSSPCPVSTTPCP